MRKSTLAAAIAAAGLAASATAANATITVTNEIANQLFSASGQSILWDFDGIANANTLFTGHVQNFIENPVSTSAPPPLDQADGGVVVNYDSHGNPYYGDPTAYGSTQQGQTSTFETLNGYYLTSFSFYMGSPDSYNHLKFTFDTIGGGTQTFDGDQIWNGASNGVAGNGDRSKGFRVYYDFGGAKVNKITFTTENTNAFEYDGLAGNLGVPEPATWALMILGFGGAGAMLRSRRRAIV